MDGEALRAGRDIVRSEQQRIGIALETLTSGLRPFFERELREVYGDGWEESARSTFRGQSSTAMQNGKWDAHAVLSVMWDQWNQVFRHRLGMAERSLVSELREYRNRWAHQDLFSDDDSYRVLDSAQRLLKAVGALEAAELIESRKIEVMRNILGRRVNDDLAAARFNRARMIDVALYAVCCVAIVATMFLVFGAHRFWPTALIAGFTVFVFGFFIHKRITADSPIYGVHECAKCTKIIYSEVCPYCDPPHRSSSIIKNGSSLRFPPFAEQAIRTNS